MPDPTTVVLIPARSGNQSVPGKNVLPLGGFPLVAYSIAAGRACDLVSDTIVSTNSESVAELCRQFGASVPFLRPEAISQANSTDIEFFHHFVDYARDSGGTVPDLIVHLRPTTPLREVAVIDEAVRYMQTHPTVTALRSMEKTELTPYKLFRMVGEFAKPFMSIDGEPEFYNWPRQRFDTTYVPNGHVDIVRPAVFESTGLLHGTQIKLWVTDHTADIDSMRDYERAKELLADPRFKPLIDELEAHNAQLP